MADELTLDADRLPTLTEVLELGREGTADLSAPAVVSPAESVNPAASGDGNGDAVAQVLALLEPRIGALLDTRLREALAPALARAADGLIRDVRAELAPTLRSLVEEAVAQALRQPRSLK
jgi:hypothetical protein